MHHDKGNSDSIRRRAWGSRLGAEYERRFAWLWAEGYRDPAAMKTHWPLEHRQPGEPPCPDPNREPSTGTFQNRIRAYREREGAPWQFAEADPVEVSAVMPILGALLEHTEGRLKTFTHAEAALLGRVRAAAPDLNPWLTYRIAHSYVLGDADDQESLEALLGFGAWRSLRAVGRFLQWTADRRPGWLLVPRHLADKRSPKRPAHRRKGVRVLSGIGPVDRRADGAVDPDGKVLRPVRTGRRTVIDYADLVGVTAGVRLALELAATMEGGTP